MSEVLLAAVSSLAMISSELVAMSSWVFLMYELHALACSMFVTVTGSGVKVFSTVTVVFLIVSGLNASTVYAMVAYAMKPRSAVPTVMLAAIAMVLFLDLVVLGSGFSGWVVSGMQLFYHIFLKLTNNI